MPNYTFETASRDIWSHGSKQALLDLISSSLATLLLLGENSRPCYFVSPWMSNFKVFDNRFRQYETLFPALADNSDIYFQEYLRNLAGRGVSVRLMVTDNSTSNAFIEEISALASSNIEWRLAPVDFHEKGILAPSFYIEGSMNLTYSGVTRNNEKITYHSAWGEGRRKISAAFLEFNRRWDEMS